MDTWVYNHPAVAGTVSIFNRYIGKSHDWIALREIQGGAKTKTCPAVSVIKGNGAESILRRIGLTLLKINLLLTIL